MSPARLVVCQLGVSVGHRLLRFHRSWSLKTSVLSGGARLLCAPYSPCSEMAAQET